MKLKTKFTLIVSIFVVTILLLTALFAFSHYKKTIAEMIAQQQFLMISALADEIDSKLLTAQQDLVDVGKSVPPDIMQNPGKAQAFLDSQPLLHRMFDNDTGFFTPAGKTFVESPYAPGRRGLDFSFREYIINTLKTKKPYISDPFMSSKPHKHPVIMLTVPLFDSKGKITGILAGSIDLMRDNFLGRISTLKVGKTGNFYMYATDGTMIMHPDRKRILVKQDRGLNRLFDMARDGFEGTGETATSYGMKAVTSFKRLKTKDWILAANYPQAEAYLPIQKVKGYFLIATIITVLVVFFVVSFVIKYLTNPLELFTRHIEELPQKTGDDRLLNIKTKDEIGTLSLAFNKMEVERKKAEEALRESEEQYRSLVNTLNIGIFRTAAVGGRFIQANPALANIHGYDSVEELLKVKVTDLWANPEDRKNYIDELRGNGYIRNKEFAFLKKDGTPILCLMTASAQYDENRNFKWIHGTVEDISEHKKLEEQLRQVQKMSAIGVLAGGVAHNFNNILTAIIGFGTMAKKRIKDDEITKEFIDEILLSAKRAAELTHGLLAFSRKDILLPKQVDLNDIVRKIHKMIGKIIGEDIELKTILVNGNLTVLVDESQMEQVLLNLVTNARDAMPDGGYLVIQTEEINIDEDYAEAHFFESLGEYAVLTVSDTGIGMDYKIRENIFEPFFTTKEVGKGTGLGLSMIYGIIKQHNGNINVYSEVGKGTTFRVYLPLVQTEEAISKPTETFPKGKGETIIVAEDDLQVRGIMKQLLKENGYEIIEAENGEEAARKFTENKSAVSLILLDVIMPVKNGREAYEEIKKLLPEIKAIFMSGYTDDVISRKGILEEGFDFISKPINPDTLMRKIRDVLDR
jgi:PAS domain S-box-containing protein